MNKFKKLASAALIASGLLISSIGLAASHSSIASQSSSIAPMLKKTTPAVVNIVVMQKTPPFILSQLPPNLPKNAIPKNVAVGSGVIFDKNKGLIVTNAHVLAHAKIVVVTLKDGRRYRAHTVAKAEDFDLAVLKIKAKHLTEMPFADSDQLEVGDFVAAIGSPFGLTQTVTSGVVSALDRDRPKIEGFQSFIQTDAPINPGNSGGALVDMKGKLVGINTAIISKVDSSAGIGFAIPSNMTKGVIKQLLKYGKVERGMLGVMAQNISADLANALGLKSSHGALVTQIVPNSPASKIDIEPRDVILKLNNTHIRSADQLRNDLGLMHPGSNISLTLNRDGKISTQHATVADVKTMKEETETPFLSGLTLRNFDELESNGKHLKGVVIVDTDDASGGTLAGLQPGDVITAVNKKAVTTTKQLHKMAADTHKDQLLLSLNRNNTDLFAVIDR